ncbi:hypothetical protein F4804DRAFT_247266 [Jackrogersella minutella]|nr:hypothetical protein F4804DRAFT_247266 [Jackrogersella minutella]
MSVPSSKTATVPMLPKKPYRLYIEVPFDLLASIDPPTTSFEPADSIASVQGKAREALDDVFKDIGSQLDIQARPRMHIYWPKPGKPLNAPDIATNYTSVAYIFDHSLSGVSKPSVLKLVAELEDGGGLSFQLIEADDTERTKINKVIGS